MLLPCIHMQEVGSVLPIDGWWRTCGVIRSGELGTAVLVKILLQGLCCTAQPVITIRGATQLSLSCPSRFFVG